MKLCTFIKKILYTGVVLASSVSLYAQSDREARLAFEKAENAFEVKKYKTSIEHLDEAEKLIQQWTPLISYLRIENLHALVTDVQNVRDPYIQPLYVEVEKYLGFMKEAPPNAVPQEKFDRVYTIEKDLPVDAIKQYYNADLVRARNVLGERKLPDAFAMFKKLSEANNPYAMGTLGDMYLYGMSIPQDREAARTWYEKAIANGNDEANVGLAQIILEAGNSSSSDYTRAFNLLQTAEKNGETRANYWLGVAYAEGMGVGQDMKKARGYLDRAEQVSVYSPRLDYYNALVKLQTMDPANQTNYLLSNVNLFPKDVVNKVLEQNKNRLAADIKKHKSSTLFFSLFGVLGSGASGYFFSEKQYFAGSCIGLCGALGIWGALEFMGNKEHAINKRTLKKIKEAQSLSIAPATFQFKDQNQYGIRFAYKF